MKEQTLKECVDIRGYSDAKSFSFDQLVLIRNLARLCFRRSVTERRPQIHTDIFYEKIEFQLRRRRIQFRFRDLILVKRVDSQVSLASFAKMDAQKCIPKTGSSCHEFLPKPKSFIVATCSNSEWSFVVHVQREPRRDF